MILAGCGGGGGGTPSPTSSSSPTGNTVDPNTGGRVRLVVNWPTRTTRSVPVAAGSLHFAVVADGTNGPTLVKELTVARPTDTTTPPATPVILDGLPVKALTLLIVAYPNADGTGVAQAKGSVTLPLSQGNPAPSITLSVDSTIDHLVLTTPKTRLAVGEQVSLSATAYDASGQVVLTRPESVHWQTSDQAVLASTDDRGTIYANPTFGSASVTVSESESGKTASLQLSVGFPLHVGLDISGARSVVPLTSSLNDDTNAFYRVTPGGGSFDWQTAKLTYSDVATKGTPVTISAPATYGDRQFAGWARDGADAGSSLSLIVDPTQTSSTTLVARYVPRAADAATGEFGPNFLHDLNYQDSPPTPNEVYIWDLSSTKIAFVTSGTFTSALKQTAVAGMNYWGQATNGEFKYLLLPDDDVADADIVVAFCARQQFVPAPSDYGFTEGAPNQDAAGVTFYHEVADTTGTGLHYGTGKRLIYLYTDSVGNDETLKGAAAHELFHALGMNGHSPHPEDLMYGGGQGISPYRLYFPGERDLNSFLSVLEKPANRAVHVRRAVPTGGQSRTVQIF